MRPALLSTVIVFNVVAFAQGPARPNVPTDAVTVVTAEQLQTILQNASTSKETGKPGSVSSGLFGRVASCSFIRLDEPDLPHVHPVSEIYIVREGAATLETGGTLIGPFTNGGVHHQAGPNGDQSRASAQSAEPIGPDHGGTAIEGGHTQTVKAGDVILIPAGVNHHWAKIDAPLVYFDIKFPKAE